MQPLAWELPYAAGAAVKKKKEHLRINDQVFLATVKSCLSKKA